MTDTEVIPTTDGVALTAAEVLEELARLDALKDVIAEHREALRGYLERLANDVAARTGTAPTLKAKGVGRAYVTEPTLRPVVTDDQAFAEWAKVRRPEAVSVRETIDGAGLLRRERDGDTVAHQIADGLRELGLVPVEVLTDSVSLEAMATEFPRTAGGGLIDPETGEALPVMMVAASRPVFTVTIEKAHRAELARRLRAAGWEPPTLPEAQE